jgi:hypothetical protein
MSWCVHRNLRLPFRLVHCSKIVVVQAEKFDQIERGDGE